MSGWNRGDRVVQATYGAGTVLDVNDVHIVIHFDNGGRRPFAAHLAVLEAAGETPGPPVSGKLPPMPRGFGSTFEGSTAKVGFRNTNGQTVLRQTNVPGILAGQSVYVLACGHCGAEYGAN